MILTDQQIDGLFAAMPGGVQGFCRDFGYRQFARKVLEAAEADKEASNTRWREVVKRVAGDANRFGRDGMKVSCEASETGQMLTWKVEQFTGQPIHNPKETP